MGIVVQAGQINTQSLLAPGAIVQIQPPSQLLINGVPSDILGIVGVASWGPLNTPIICGSLNEGVLNFGTPFNRKNDLMSHLYCASLTGASNFRGVRVSDGTDIKASKAILDTTTPTAVTGMTASGLYSGILGNSIQVTIQNGSTPNTKRIIVALPSGLNAGRVPEQFDNIPGTGATLWQNMVDAINVGQNGIRGPSELIRATIGTATAAPANATYTLTGGTDGETVTSSDLIGVDVSPRTGLYVLRGTQCSCAFVADLDDDTTYAEQEAFGISEGIFIHITGPVSQTITQAASAKATAGLSNYDTKFLVGDWIYFFDTFNGIRRLISPQGFAAGVKVSYNANESALNKQIFGIVGTQTTVDGGSYSNADVVFACDNGLDFIYNPSPGGNYFALQTGQNCSPNPLTRMDSYTTLTNYLAYSIASAIGFYIGQLQNPTIRQQAKSTLVNFLSNLFEQGFIGDVNYPNDASRAFKVILDASNN